MSRAYILLEFDVHAENVVDDHLEVDSHLAADVFQSKRRVLLHVHLLLLA